MTCSLKASSVGGSRAACLSVVEASAYRSSSSVLQFLLLLPYNNSTYLRAVSSEMLSEDDPPNSDSCWTESMCSTNFVKAVRLPILKNALVVSHPVNAWASGRHAHTLLPSSPAIVWMGMYCSRVTIFPA